jgi:hypothetical protein
MTAARCTAILFTALLAAFTVPEIDANQAVAHTFGGDPTISATVDDDGGWTGEFRFVFDTTEQAGGGNLILWDDMLDVNYDGGADNDFAGTGSGIVLVQSPEGAGDVDEVTGRQADPLRATRFSAGSFEVEQYTAIIDDGQFVLYEWVINNTGSNPLPAKLLFTMDWDLDGGENDARSGWDSQHLLAWQQDMPENGDPDYTTGGVALIHGTLDNFSLSPCCDLSETDATQNDYFQGVGTGDQDSGQTGDKEVGVSVNLGTIAPDDWSCVAMVQAVAQGKSAEHALSNLQTEVDRASRMWQSAPTWDECKPGSVNQPHASTPINPSFGDAWYFPPTAGQGFFVVVYEKISQIFLSWFTFDTERDATEPAANLREPYHRWMTAQGEYSGNTATLKIYRTEGMVFDSATPPFQLFEDGTLTLHFDDCYSGTADYDILSIDRQGSIPIERVANDNVEWCMYQLHLQQGSLQ